MASELRRVSSVLLPSGGERIVLPRSRQGGHMDSVSAMVLGVSMALERAAQPELVAEAERPVSDAWRDEAREAVLKKRRDMLRKDPMAGVRQMARR